MSCTPGQLAATTQVPVDPMPITTKWERGEGGPVDNVWDDIDMGKQIQYQFPMGLG